MSRVCWPALALLAMSAAAHAQADDPLPEPSPAVAKEKKICRVEKSTGSRIRETRVCMTAAEWRRLNDRTTKEIDAMGNANGASELPNRVQ